MKYTLIGDDVRNITVEPYKDSVQIKINGFHVGYFNDESDILFINRDALKKLDIGVELQGGQ